MSSCKCPHCEYYMWEGKEFYECELEQENADLKKYIERMKEPELQVIDADIALENAELKVENERLKALCDTYRTCYQAKHSDVKCLLPKYRTTLQEIMVIAEELLEKGLEPQSVEHQLRLKGKRELASIILDLIYKAEEE